MSPISKHWFVLIATFKFEQTKFCPPKLGNPESQLSSIKVGLSLKVVFYGKCFCYQRLCSIKGHLPSKVVSHQRLSSIKGGFPSLVVYHQRKSSSKFVVFHHRSYFIKDWLPSMVVINFRLFPTNSCPPSMVVFHQRLSSIKGDLP